MDEQAKVRLRSSEKTARIPPSIIVITPNSRMTIPQYPLCKKIREEITITPKIPVFVIIPDNSALAGAGATG